MRRAEVTRAHYPGTRVPDVRGPGYPGGMCASYGLDPRFSDAELLAEQDAALLEGLRSWAAENAGETLRPTGRIARNLNPLVVPDGAGAALQSAWWGHLVGGAPARYPSINTRSERLRERSGALRRRAIVPATAWFERRASDRTWHEFGLGDGVLFGMAAVVQNGRTDDGAEFTCYSIVMRDAPARLAGVHDRMPVLVPAAFAGDWLHSAQGPDTLEEALRAAAGLDDRVTATERPDDKGEPDRLF